MRSEVNVLIAHYLPDLVSGAELAIADMVDRRAGWLKYTMLTPGDDKLANFYRRKGYEVWAKKMHTRRRRYPGLHTLQSYFSAKELSRRDIHVVLCNTFPAASRVRTACRFAGIPYAIYVREYISDNALHRKILAGADRILAVSGDVKTYLSSMIDPARIVVAYDHVNAQPILDRVETHKLNGRRALPISPEFPVIGLIGRITPYKQQDLFVRAVSHVLSVIPEARFVIVGASRAQDAGYERMVRSLAAELGLEDKVLFLGHRGDVIEIMTELAMCCIVSTREPFPRTLLEAQVVGCPVIAADSGGCPEMVEDGVSGLLFPVKTNDSADQLSDQVLRVLLDQDLRHQLSSLAKKRIRNSFSSCDPVEKFESEVKRLVT